ncbi:unnamed protein product [Caenorhabditis sp. 36 PRJEB53466]|nr:unnamed protein product [Caenorhabditis sp. 36 PRJEB53466]
MSGDVDYPHGCLPVLSTGSVSQQVERLRKLSGCLYDCKPNNHEEVQNADRFRRLFYHLSQKEFLDNHNPELQINLSLCLANIIRVFQPECPTANALELKDVYMYLFNTLGNLGEISTDSPKFKNYFHLVEAIEKILHPLSEMKDHDDKEAIPVFRSLIRTILKVMCGRAWKKDHRERMKRKSSEGEPTETEEDEEDEDSVEKIRKALISMGTTAISELDIVPNEILDVLFHHIIPPQRTHFAEARLLAQDIIRSCMESGNNQLAHAIRNTITAACKEGQLPDEFTLTGTESRSKYFSVLRWLHHISYELVSDAIEELYYWLQSERPDYRKEAVTIVGQITQDRTCKFGDQQYSGANEATWQAFLSSANDVDPDVRKEFVRQTGEVLRSHHNSLRTQLIKNLSRLSKDINDEIRIEVVSTVTDVAKDRLEVFNDTIFEACAERMWDKKPQVRNNAIKRMMDLYYHLMTQTVGGKGVTEYTETDKDAVRFIPKKVFNVLRLFQRTPAYQESRILIERYFQLNFVPYQKTPEVRVRMMADIFRRLDDVGVAMFTDVINRSSQLRRAMIGLISQISQSDKVTEAVEERIHRIAQIFPDPAILEKVIKIFANDISMHEEAFNMAKKLVADKYTSEEILAATRFVHKRSCENYKLSDKAVTSFRHFIARITPISFDVATAEELIALVAKTVQGKIVKQKAAEEHFERDLLLLKTFTEHFTHLFTSEQIVEKIRSSMLNTDEPKAVEAALNYLSKIISNTAFRQKIEAEGTKKEIWFLAISKNLKDLIIRSEPAYRRSCKLTTRLVASLLGKEKAVEHFDTILQTLIDRLQLESEGAANAFQVLGEIFRTDVHHFIADILPIVESDRIGSTILASNIGHDEDPIEFNELVPLEKQPWPAYALVKVYAAKFATKVMMAITSFASGSDEKRRLESASQQLIDVLSDVIQKKGDFGGRQCEVEKARLRASAAACLLKLSAIVSCRLKMDTRLFKNMAYMITDEAYCVRLHYAFHVKKGCGRKLPIEFAACYGLINLGLNDEDGENKLDGFKSICLNQARLAFAERRESRAIELKLEGAARAAFCAETVVAYVVWLLANYDRLERVEENVEADDSEKEIETKVANLNQLFQLQECLWQVIDALKLAKCDMQKVWKVLEKLKTCGDKPMKFERLSAKDMLEHNKKLWALSDLGITMMLYRAKLQMQDQDAKEAGYNLMFFYLCSYRDKADPSNVYAPDYLIEEEKRRNGRIPPPKYAIKAEDVLAKLAPSQNETNSTTSSTNAKNTSKNTSGTTKKRGGGGAKKAGKGKRKSGGKAESSEDELEEEPQQKTSPKKPRGKRAVYDLPESEEDEEEQEVIPLPKRRGAPAPTPSTSSNGTSAAKKNGTTTSPKKTRRKDDEEEEDTLGNLELSPIMAESATGRSRRSARNVTLTASTPLIAPKPKVGKRKREEPVEEEEEEEEKVEEPKRRASGRKAAPSPAKKKSVESPKKKQQQKKTNKYGLPLEEEEEETPPTPKTRTSARLSKK